MFLALGWLLIALSDQSAPFFDFGWLKSEARD